jgi:hypothetical protein
MCESCELPEAADECVAAGIAWLDRNVPGDWRSRVNLRTLNIENMTECILGQVFRDAAIARDHCGYEYAVTTFFEGMYEDYITGPLGFSNFEDIDCAEMTEAWVRALSAE